MSICICADDFAFSRETSLAIIDLLAKNKIHATSCMANMPRWAEDGKKLVALCRRNQSVQVGLHLNLTDGRPLTQASGMTDSRGQFIGLFSLWWRLQLRLLSLDQVMAEFKAQWDAFVSVMGRAPDFIDGHQHIQHFPGVRIVLLRLYQALALKKKPWLRLSYQKDHRALSVLTRIKARVIYALGGRSLKHLLVAEQIPYQEAFAGIYHFSQGDFSVLLPLFRQMVSPNGLIMCHPALPSGNRSDPIAKQRSDEYEALLAEA